MVFVIAIEKELRQYSSGFFSHNERWIHKQEAASQSIGTDD